MTYWYLFTSFYCPVCGATHTYKERKTTPKLDQWADRHEEVIHYDYCDAL